MPMMMCILTAIGQDDAFEYQQILLTMLMIFWEYLKGPFRTPVGVVGSSPI